jgi:hypothetical protein
MKSPDLTAFGSLLKRFGRCSTVERWISSFGEFLVGVERIRLGSAAKLFVSRFAIWDCFAVTRRASEEPSTLLFLHSELEMRVVSSCEER